MLGISAALFAASHISCMAQTSGGNRSPAAVAGLDHIPVAVSQLDAAASRYTALGFSLKPGRPHRNGIQNRHVKFRDGSEIELITAPDSTDALTGEYRRSISSGDGPAFVAFFAPELSAVTSILDARSQPYRSDGGITFETTDRLRYIFFGRRNASPTDRPEHFDHPNTAESLFGVWLAGDDLAAELGLLEDLGARIADRAVNVPDSVTAPVGELDLGEIIFLPSSYQLVNGRRIVGATILCRDLDVLRIVLGRNGIVPPSIIQTPRGRSMFIAPDVALGLWLEFRETR